MGEGSAVYNWLLFQYLLLDTIFIIILFLSNTRKKYNNKNSVS